MRQRLLDRLAGHAERRGEHLAVLSQGASLTYRQLWQAAQAVAARLGAQGVRAGDRVGLLGERTVEDFYNLLGIWLAGAVHVPLNHKFPPERNRRILDQAGARGILYGPRSEKEIARLVRTDQGAEPAGEFPGYARWNAPADDSDSPAPELAYIIFTSGSTGVPKGVPITFSNLLAYLDNVQACYPQYESDRWAQISDFSFDASVHEIGLAWASGATLCVIPANGALMWPRYVSELAVTVLLAVPSAVMLSKRSGVLKEGSLPSVRLAFLGAEALPLGTVRHLAEAAPNSRIVNLWGPTEATVSFTHFPVDISAGLPEVIPIGLPYPNQHLALWDEHGEPVGEACIGQLYQAGSQVTAGYWRNPQLNESSFVLRDGLRWYRTGDLAIWDARHGYCYMGRVDRQIKLKGFRVELQDCESAIRTVTGRDSVCVLPWPKSETGVALGLAAVVGGAPMDPEAIKAALRERLPSYMVPERILFIDQFPLNTNGKVDLKALQSGLDDLVAAAAHARPQL
ncbi:MAG: D-alanine--poly(phosphoribitol) ligase [Zoogloea sp.]|nr:D-alanine--poly(phosphoribitol) ligase [Zoogloea sp.]